MTTTKLKHRRRTSLAAKIIERPPNSDLMHIIQPLRPFAMHVAALIVDPRNPQLHEDRNLKAIADSMRRFGQDQPLIYRREDGVIIKGNGRYLAARAKLGWEWIAAIAVDDPIIEASARGVADNEASRLSDVDSRMLGMVLQTIKGDDDALAGLVGYTECEVDALISSMASDHFIDEPQPPKPRRGAPPTDAVGLAAELIVQWVPIDRLITAIGERYYLEKLKGRRAESLAAQTASALEPPGGCGGVRTPRADRRDFVP